MDPKLFKYSKDMTWFSSNIKKLYIFEPKVSNIECHMLYDLNV